MTLGDVMTGPVKAGPAELVDGLESCQVAWVAACPCNFCHRCSVRWQNLTGPFLAVSDDAGHTRGTRHRQTSSTSH